MRSGGDSKERRCVFGVQGLNRHSVIIIITRFQGVICGFSLSQLLTGQKLNSLCKYVYSFILLLEQAIMRHKR